MARKETTELFKNRIIGYATKPADQFTANPLNYRKHPQRQRDAVNASLRELGWISTVIENVTTGNVIDGHERIWNALQRNEDVPYLQVELSEAEERLALAVFDPITNMAETDAQILDDLLREVNTGEAALQQLLAEMADTAGLYGDKGTEGDTPAEVDRAEELRQKWGVQPGQLWQLGEHRLICGDCTDPATVARVMGGDKPKLMVTDPPYGVEYDADWRNDAAEKGLISYAARRVGKVENDDRADWTEAWKLFPGDVVYCWHDGRRASVVEQNLSAAGFEIRCQIVWVKPNAPISRGHYRWGHEACWYAVRKGGNADWVGDHSQTTAWEGATDKNTEGGHSTQKPVWLMEKSIANHKGDVYEPFSGSGTTIIACENLGRKCRAVEISPAYVAVALERWSVHTGKTPVLIG